MTDLALHLALYWVSIIGFSFAVIPLTTPVLLAARLAPPVAIAALGCSAAAVGAVLDHRLVRRGFDIRMLAKVRERKLFKRAEGWAKVAPFLTTLAFASLPLPYVIVRVLMPLSGYPVKPYVTAVTIGRFFHIYVIAAFGVAFEIPTKYLVGFLIGSVTLGAGTMIFHHVRDRRATATAAADDKSDPSP